MELITLDSNYQPAELVERYNSLVWTERYFSAGDFQLVTTDVERMLKLLPLESVVSLRESTVPMLVELHKIEKKMNSAPQLTITGRSFETVLERRIAVRENSTTGPRVPWFENRRIEAEAAYYAIKEIVVDTVLSPNDALPMLNLKDYEVDPSLIDFKDYEIKPGSLYAIVTELLNACYHGLKTVRPIQTSDTVIDLEIYNGTNRSNEVVFDARFDQFEDSTYLLSKAGSANLAYVFSSTQSDIVFKTQADEPVGLDRRVLYLDISSETGTDNTEARNTRGLVELYKNNVTALYDGQLAQQLATGFNSDYFLGDIIRLDGEYGLSELVRVAEFIRSEDSTGTKAYPTFQVIPDE